LRVALFLLLLVVPPHLMGQTELPPFVKEGLEALGTGNCEKAIALWTAPWSEAQKAQMAGICPTLKQFGESVHGYDLLKVIDVSPHLRRVYALLLYDGQPVYAMVIAYQPAGKDWIVGGFILNADPDQVIPVQVLPPQRAKP